MRIWKKVIHLFARKPCKIDMEDNSVQNDEDHSDLAFSLDHFMDDAFKIFVSIVFFAAVIIGVMLVS